MSKQIHSCSAGLLLCCFFLDTSVSEDCPSTPFKDSRTEPDPEPLTQSPKISLNLAGFKAAFASQPCSSYGNKSSVTKASNSGPTQTTMQSFLKGSHSPGVTSVMKQTKCSPGGKSALARFRYGSSFSDMDVEEDSGCDVTVVTPHNSALELSSSEPDAYRADVTEEISEATSNSHPEGAESQTELRPFDEDCSVMPKENCSPDAKRARIEKTSSPVKPESNIYSNHLDKSSLAVDSPVCLQRRTVPLQFCLRELVGKMKRLEHQQAHRAEEALCYRRFKAKINPGENQSAEAELKKEIK